MEPQNAYKIHLISENGINFSKTQEYDGIDDLYYYFFCPINITV